MRAAWVQKKLPVLICSHVHLPNIVLIFQARVNKMNRALNSSKYLNSLSPEDTVAYLNTLTSSSGEQLADDK